MRWSSSSTTVLKSDLSTSKRFAPFLSLLGLLVLLVAFTLFLSSQILADVADTKRQFDAVLIPVVLVLPLTLLGAVGYQIWTLLRDRKQGKPGTQLKMRISLFFALTAVLASVPQTILSISFIDTAMKTWVNQRWGEALQGGLDTALEYHHDRIEELTNISQSPLIPDMVRRALPGRDVALLANALEASNLKPDALQVFDPTGSELLSIGEKSARLTRSAGLPMVDGPLPKETSGSVTLLRQLRHVVAGGIPYSVVVSQILPKGFEEATQSLTEAVETFKKLQTSNDTFRNLLSLFFLLFALPILLIALLISFTQSDELIRPLINLESATRRIASGDYTTKILTPERDELAFLAESFNAMTAELAVSRTKLQQTEKVTAWQEIARQLAHELRNPLTPIRLSAERILRRAQSDPSRLVEIVEPAVEAIVTEVVRLDTLLKEFAGFARLPAPQKSRVDLKPLIERVLGTYAASQAELTVSAAGVLADVTVQADERQLEQVFANLVKNAVDAMGGKGQITAVSNLVKKGNISYCRVQLHDNGPGIPADLRDRVFHPYVTSKADGTGLGLAIVERILFDHQGRVWFESEPGFGTTFFLDLPLESAT